VIDPDIGWRLAFLIGASLALVIFFMRLWLPESPRWLMTHGHTTEAEQVIAVIEQQFAGLPPARHLPRVKLRTRSSTPLWEVAQTLFMRHRQRTYVGLALMAAQAFFYNAIFFTYALLLINFYGVSATRVGWYLLPFALGNLAGPILLGKLFDTVGRKPMIVATYALSGVLLAASGWLFAHDLLSAVTQTVAWTAIFFIASCAASSAYLTVSEIFPLEIRAMAISIFYAVGTLVGGVGAPAIFGALIGSHSRVKVAWGYAGASLLLLIAAATEAWLGVKAEGQSLEAISTPLAAHIEGEAEAA
jgi:MFS family permease